MREPSRTVGERGYVRHPPPSAAGAVRGRGGAGEPRLSLYSGGAPAVFRNTIHTHTHTRAGFTEQGAWHAKSRICIYRCEMAALLAWRAACTQWRRLRSRMLGRIRACLPGIASAIACSCAWLVCSVVCAKSAVVSKAGSIVHHMVCGMRACWMMLNQ